MLFQLSLSCARGKHISLGLLNSVMVDLRLNNLAHFSSCLQILFGFWFGHIFRGAGGFLLFLFSLYAFLGWSRPSISLSRFRLRGCSRNHNILCHWSLAFRLGWHWLTDLQSRSSFLLVL